MLQEFADGSQNQPVTAGLVEVAPIDWIGDTPPDGIPQRMLSGVSQIVQQSLASEHTLARFNEQQFLILIPHEGVEQVTKGAEELRQRVATTEFVADGHTYQTTVTCALADAATHGTGPSCSNSCKRPSTKQSVTAATAPSCTTANRQPPSSPPNWQSRRSSWRSSSSGAPNT